MSCVTPAATGRGPAIWRGNVVYGASGRFSIWARVLVSARLPRIVAVETLRRGKPIAPADVRVEYSESFPVPGDFAAGIDQVSGRIPARTITTGSEVHLSQLLAAADINRGLEGADFGDAPDGGGVLVRSVQDGSPAAQAGLRTNDLIVGVGRTPVSNTKSFREASKGLNLLLLNVRRGSGVVLIPIR